MGRKIRLIDLTLRDAHQCLWATRMTTAMMRDIAAGELRLYVDGALEARAAAPPGLTVLVGEEIRTRNGDLIAVFLSRAISPGIPARTR